MLSDHEDQPEPTAHKTSSDGSRNHVLQRWSFVMTYRLCMGPKDRPLALSGHSLQVEMQRRSTAISVYCNICTRCSCPMLSDHEDQPEPTAHKTSSDGSRNHVLQRWSFVMKYGLCMGPKDRPLALSGHSLQVEMQRRSTASSVYCNICTILLPRNNILCN